MEIIEEAEYHHEVTPKQLDAFLAQGWRHFGPLFFRYSLAFMYGSFEEIIALRVDLENFTPTKSQRRILRKNADVETRVGPAFVDARKEKMFVEHAERFTDNQPDSIYSFISKVPATSPNRCDSLDVLLGDDLVATSFLDMGDEATSSVYAMFEPTQAKRGLGIFTILAEIEYARAQGKRWYYIGYATTGPSVYDYKKQLPALEVLDWETGTWSPMARVIRPQ